MVTLCCTQTLATVSAVMSVISTTVGNLVGRSMYVYRQLKPFECGKGPTKPTCPWAKRASDCEKTPMGEFV